MIPPSTPPKRRFGRPRTSAGLVFRQRPCVPLALETALQKRRGQSFGAMIC